MLTFDFGRSDADDLPIARRLWDGAGPSLSLTVPLFVLGLVAGIALALFVAFFRETYIDRAVLVLCMLTMSVASLLYIIAGQYLVGMLLKWFPISGFDPDPAVVGALPRVAGAGRRGVRHRRGRALLAHRLHRGDEPRLRAHGPGQGLRRCPRHGAARAAQRADPDPHQRRGADPFPVHRRPALESFFGIPGLGALTVEAIQGNDFSTLRTMVYLGALLFILGQILTDISYAIADPRVRLS